MVLEILADTGQVVHRIDPKRGEFISRAYARQKQDLGRIDGSR